MIKSFLAAALAALSLGIASACGGDDDDSSSDVSTPSIGGVSPTIGEGDSEPTESNGDDAIPTQRSGSTVVSSVEPGTTRVEVEGETLVYSAEGSSFYSCEVEAERIQVNSQTSEGHDFLLQASLISGEWLGNIAFTVGETSNDNRYTATLADGDFVVDETGLTYSGAMVVTEAFDIETARDVEGSIAVNCASAGDDPSAEIGGETFVFPLSGSQSVDCEITDENTFIVRVNRLSSDGQQLTIEGRPEGEGTIGNVVVITGDDSYTATLFGSPPEGLVIEGSTITFTGPFVHTVNREDQGEVAGTATATCP